MPTSGDSPPTAQTRPRQRDHRLPPDRLLPRPPHSGDQRHAGPVRQVRMRRRVEHDQVSPCANAQVADISAAQGVRSARRCGPDRLRRGHMHLPHGERDAQRHAGGVARAGVAVRGDRHRHAGGQQPPGVRIRLPGRRTPPPAATSRRSRRMRRARPRRHWSGTCSDQPMPPLPRPPLVRQDLARAGSRGPAPGAQHSPRPAALPAPSSAPKAPTLLTPKHVHPTWHTAAHAASIGRRARTRST